MQISKNEFCDALAQLASGVSIITTALDDDRRGITATAVCSVSAEPPTVLVCVNSATGTSKMIAEAGCFAVNFLDESQQSVSNVFAGATNTQGDERFEHGDWSTDNRQKVPLLKGALGQLECRVDRIVCSGTHDIYFGIIEGVTTTTGLPLIYHGGKYLSGQCPEQ